MTHPSITPALERQSAGHRLQRTLTGAAIVAALFGALVSTGSPAMADSDDGSTIANVAVAPGITLTGLTPSFTLSGAPGATVTGLAAVSFNVETNNVAGYAVTVLSRSADMVSADQDNSDVIPIGTLKVRAEGGTLWSPLSNSVAVTVHSQANRSIDGGDVLRNEYQIRIPVVNADTYTATLDYVATTL